MAYGRRGEGDRYADRDWYESRDDDYRRWARNSRRDYERSERGRGRDRDYRDDDLRRSLSRDDRRHGADEWNRDRDRDYRDAGYGRGRRGDWRDDSDRYTQRGWDADLTPTAYRGSYFGDYGSYDPYYDTEYDRARWQTRQRQAGNERGFWDRASDEVSSWLGDEEATRRRRMDQLGQHQYRGRGPKNYTRSAERIREDVNDRLTDDWRVDASDIEVQIEGTEVTLTGSVPNRFQRRLAEDVAEEVSGVTHVQNNLRVKDQWQNESVSTTGS
jgi:osmotically-inducible protein OsmY